ncbi:MAG: biotin/lipoyl-containing protein, partial [Acidobacteriota bacterium]
MPTDFTLPELGENVTAGDVARVLVAVGDSIVKDQAVLELETDKATIEVPSSVAGVVKELRVKQGERIKVGQVVLTVDAAAGDAGGTAAKESAKPEAKSKPEAESTPAADAKPAADEGGLNQRQESAGNGRDAAQKGASERDRGTTDAPADERFADHSRAGGRADDDGRVKPRGEVVNIDRGARPAAAAPAAPAEAASEGA